MELSGEVRLAAPRARVWAALNDPAVLARAIDGVERLEAVGENRFEGALAAKVGPVRATFTGVIELSDLDPPNAYRLTGEGKGGAAGFAKGSAEVRLAETEDGGTLLSYVARSQVGGRLAQLGARLIEGAARSYADSFFANLKAIVEAPETEPAAPAEQRPAARAAAEAPAPDVEAALVEETRSGGIPPLVWAGILAIVVILLVVWLF